MRTVRLLLVAVVTLPALACGGSSPKELILGKWEYAEDKEAGALEFEKDGALKMNLGLLPLKGKYQWLDDKTVQVDVENPMAGLPGKIPAEAALRRKFQIVSIDKNELVATDAADGKTHRFKRVK